MIHIAPSILAADFSRLGEQVLETERAGAQRIHIDVMDGHFVPNLSMGPVVVKGLRKVTRLPLEVHLMVEDPGRFVAAFLDEGADTLIVHEEVLPDPRALVRQMHERGKKIGMAVNPETSEDRLEPFLGEIDLALCMTVHPGFGGQAFIPESLDKIRRLRRLIGHRPCELEVDGGIELHTALPSVQAGANVLVIGTAIFAAPQGPAQAVKAFSALANQGSRIGD
jgi:ribulose-phosphate 3-epimerase